MASLAYAFFYGDRSIFERTCTAASTIKAEGPLQSPSPYFAGEMVGQPSGVCHVMALIHKSKRRRKEMEEEMM
jgi:hypothetical protein